MSVERDRQLKHFAASSRASAVAAIYNKAQKLPELNCDKNKLGMINEYDRNHFLY